MKIGCNKDIHKDVKKFPVIPQEPSRPEDTDHKMDKPITNFLVAQHESIEPGDNQKVIAEKHNDEKLAFILLNARAGLVLITFGRHAKARTEADDKIDGISIIHNR